MKPSHDLIQTTPSRIAMDGATFRRRNDGTISIEPARFVIWIELVIFGIVALALAVSTFSAVAESEWWDVLKIVGFLLASIGLILFLLSLSRRKRIQLDRVKGSLRIGHGPDARLVNLSSISRVALTFSSGPDGLDLALVLHDGVRIPIGSVSGDLGDAYERGSAIATMIAEETGATVTGLTESPVSRSGTPNGEKARTPPYLMGTRLRLVIIAGAYVLLLVCVIVWMAVFP